MLLQCTASTSQILGNNECFEPITSNIYSRRTLAGEFVLANKYLIQDLMYLGIWDDNIKNNIIQNKGSIQYIENIPERLKDKYKIVWEMSMKNLIDMLERCVLLKFVKHKPICIFGWKTQHRKH